MDFGVACVYVFARLCASVFDRESEREREKEKESEYLCVQARGELRLFVAKLDLKYV